MLSCFDRSVYIFNVPLNRHRTTASRFLRVCCAQATLSLLFCFSMRPRGRAKACGLFAAGSALKQGNNYKYETAIIACSLLFQQSQSRSEPISLLPGESPGQQRDGLRHIAGVRPVAIVSSWLFSLQLAALIRQVLSCARLLPRSSSQYVTLPLCFSSVNVTWTYGLSITFKETKPYMCNTKLNYIRLFTLFWLQCTLT